MAQVIRIPSVTGIDVELKLAGPGARSFAFIIDFKIRALAALCWLFLGAMIAGMASAASGATPEEIGTEFLVIVFAPAAAIMFLYHPLIEVIMRGRSPGKAIAGVRVVRLADGGTPGIGALLVRNVARLIDSMPGGYAIGIVTTMLTKNAVRFGDLAAGTVLVYDEAEEAGAFATIRTSAIERLGLAEAQLVRELANRWYDLNPAVSKELGRKLLAKHGIDSSRDSPAESYAKLRALLA